MGDASLSPHLARSTSDWSLSPRSARGSQKAARQVDWEALWLEVSGPGVDAADLALMEQIFQSLDRRKEGVLRVSELHIFKAAFDSALSGISHAAIAEDPDEEGGKLSLNEDLSPRGWTSFNAACLAAYGQRAWRRGLDNVAAVCRVARSAAPEENEPWTISIKPGGEIVSAWFSQAELKPEEREACRALAHSRGWRCLSCEAEAVLPKVTSGSASPISPPGPARSSAKFSLLLPPPPEPQRAFSHTASALCPGQPDEEPEPRLCLTARAEGEPRRPERPKLSVILPRGARGGGASWRSTLWQCESLGEMLAHRALRPIRKPVSLGDEVVIEDVSKGTARPGSLGCRATVMKIWVPSDAVVKRQWCQVQIRRGDPSSEVMLPTSSVINLTVPLRPGDQVEAFRPNIRVSGQHSTYAALATVLRVLQDRPHLIEVSFGETETAVVPLSWIRRAELSAWTQVLRRAPFSTLMFLLADLGLSPGSPEDERELEERMRRDFEPHGRFQYVGSSKLLHRAAGGEFSDLSPSSAKLAKGDTGKVNSIDPVMLEAEVIPDRKRHLRLRVSLTLIVPEATAPETLATCGPTAMRAFDEDPALIAAIKRGDDTGLRAELARLPRSGVLVDALLNETDADGNTAFHAAVYMQRVDLWKVAWTALVTTPGGAERDEQDALGSLNDFGRTPLWIAIESGSLPLCELLLKAGSQVDQEAPLLSGTAGAGFEFCGGPGFVNVGVEYEVTLYTPAGPSGLRLWHQLDTEKILVSRSFGEPANACVTPGDVLLAVGGTPTSSLSTLQQVIRTLKHSPRPLTLRFLKGGGLFSRPLQRACELGFPELVELLLAHKADPHWRDVVGNSAMDRAVHRRNRAAAEKREPFDKCVGHLVEAGATEDGKVKIFDPASATPITFQAPAHWDACSQMFTEGRFYMRVVEETDPKVLEHFRSVVDRSLSGSASRKITTSDRQGRLPTKLLVERVQRVENVADLREFLQRRCVMRHERGEGSLEKVSPPLRVKFSYSAIVGRDADGGGLDESLNEAFLFHGTTPDAVRGITRDGFLLAMSGSNAGTAFGRGVYFAEDCLKCDEYTSEAPFGHEFAGLRPLLLCRVLLGNVAVSEDRDVSLEIQSIMQRKCDSLIADRKAAVGTFREFVVFDADQVYTDYVLWYRRSYG